MVSCWIPRRLFLLFHISKHGIWVDTERTKAIMKIPPSHSKKYMQSFFRKINFVRRFIPYFDEIMKPLQQMIKKYVQFKWTFVEKEAFKNIKATIVIAPSPQTKFHWGLIDVHFCIWSFPWGSAHTEGWARELMPHCIHEHLITRHWTELPNNG